MASHAQGPERALGFLCSIGAVSTSFRLTPRSIRYYEECGLIAPVRDGRNRRMFDQRARARLQLIATLRRSGLSIQEIEQVLRREGEGRDAQVAVALEKLADQRAALEAICENIDAAIAQLGAHAGIDFAAQRDPGLRPGFSSLRR